MSNNWLLPNVVSASKISEREYVNISKGVIIGSGDSNIGGGILSGIGDIGDRCNVELSK